MFINAIFVILITVFYMNKNYQRWQEFFILIFKQIGIICTFNLCILGLRGLNTSWYFQKLQYS